MATDLTAVKEFILSLLNGYVNKQNCRIWSEANPQVYVETPLHPEKLTVWCALWAGGIIDEYKEIDPNYPVPSYGENHSLKWGKVLDNSSNFLVYGNFATTIITGNDARPIADKMAEFLLTDSGSKVHFRSRESAVKLFLKIKISHY
ncbi:hypothetical protein TNCV_14511 [Trichonephila clavipes]|nr:hypothetical protein TNCV_14511 [Trichonephila clavipes]